MTPEGPEDVPRYIAAIAAELASIARKANFPMLYYLLDMAREEAQCSVMPPHISPPKQKSL